MHCDFRTLGQFYLEGNEINRNQFADKTQVWALLHHLPLVNQGLCPFPRFIQISPSWTGNHIAKNVMPLVLLTCTPAHFICETGWPNTSHQQKVTLKMGLIKKENSVVQKAWYLLFLWRRRAEYDFSMNYFNWWFYRLMHRHEESLGIGIVSYFQSLLTLKTWWERKYEIDIFQEPPVITIVSAWMNDKKVLQKQLKGWRIISYIIQTPAHPSGGIIQRKD